MKSFKLSLSTKSGQSSLGTFESFLVNPPPLPNSRILLEFAGEVQGEHWEGDSHSRPAGGEACQGDPEAHQLGNSLACSLPNSLFPGPCSSLFLLGNLQLLPNPYGQQQGIQISEFYRDYPTLSLPFFPEHRVRNKNYPAFVLKFDWGKKRDQEDKTLRKKLQLEPFCMTVIRENKTFPYPVKCKFHSSLMDN